ncbi:hypothetical protein M422DRAFT_59771 [Sphaerobolus stellatus SS14]|uniref:Uncharacterized protein n=1 Tax=Sphaerobolus stellatus (strain SS14) TaxID=990650 RepID=A0A0C9VEZ7_SPHS4|nr:hypothetical protein M422DRAFT_59771 [Sphaerobolus stellatus SS14]
MASNQPPPTYEDDCTQLLICPAPNAVQFQKGYLGAQGERAAIEGELLIKGAEPAQWDSVMISLKTIETYKGESIELSSSNITLFSRKADDLASTIPSTLGFSIPLTTDTPQCIHTAHSSISHRLIATLMPTNASHQPLIKAIAVHTRRYTSPSHPLLLSSPFILEKEDPALVKIELPRTTFRIGEPIPVYITIPTPDIAIVRDRGLNLRNVMAELVRTVSLGNIREKQAEGSSDAGNHASTSVASSSFNADEKSSTTHHRLTESVTSDRSIRTVITRTGSTCRFHKSRSVRIRLLVYPHPSARQSEDLSDQDPEGIDNEDSDCGSITQASLLHDISFCLKVNINFMSAASRSEYISSSEIPILLLPNSAPQPEVDESITSAYHKKHDKPPERTVRHDDADAHHNGAGPSGLVPTGAPPPFEERDAPPPFSVSDPAPSTSTSRLHTPPPFSVSDPAPSTSRLPTFLEAEADVNGRLPVHVEDGPQASIIREPGHVTSFPGEGVDFGFTPGEQFDGISSSVEQSPGLPPSIIDADQDTDVTQFADYISQPERAFEALALTFEQPSGSIGSLDELDQPPPPPPPLDDPSDPPPSIDVEEFRRPPGLDHSSPQQPTQDLDSITVVSDNPHAPPPYLQQPDEHTEAEEAVMNPPPYVDLLPARNAR